MSVPILIAGTFERGSTVNGKTVVSWSVWNTVPHYCGGDCYHDVVLRFADGTKLFASSVSRRVR